MSTFQVSGFQFDEESEKSNFSSTDVLNDLGITSKKSELFNVVLLDDNDHTYDYVIEMLADIFGYSLKTGFDMACEVDFRGRVIVFTATKTLAEEKSNEIMMYGADWRLERSKGPMLSVIEPAE